MYKNVLSDESDYNKWFKVCSDRTWMDLREPKRYPCLVVWVEVIESNTFRHTIHFEFVYFEDLLMLR